MPKLNLVFSKKEFDKKEHLEEYWAFKRKDIEKTFIALKSQNKLIVAVDLKYILSSTTKKEKEVLK